MIIVTILVGAILITTLALGILYLIATCMTEGRGPGREI